MQWINPQVKPKEEEISTLNEDIETEFCVSEKRLG